MKVSELEHLCGAVCLTGEYQDREIACGYTCDLLSHVMGRGQADMAWITVQTHMNVIAVAALMDFACVVFPESLPVEAAIVDKARQEDVILLSSGQTAFELAALLAANGVPPARNRGMRPQQRAKSARGQGGGGSDERAAAAGHGADHAGGGAHAVLLPHGAGVHGVRGGDLRASCAYAQRRAVLRTSAGDERAGRGNRRGGAAAHRRARPSV